MGFRGTCFAIFVYHATESYRDISRVDAQWITAKEDWKELRRREKERTKGQDANPQPKTDEDQVYEAEMDDMKCILYSHGGTPISLLRSTRFAHSNGAKVAITLEA